MSKDGFRTLMRVVTGAVAGRGLDGALESFLNHRFPADDPAFLDIEAACRRGVEEGWMAIPV
ncbi:DUF4863 family protein [bacterium]|nr:DUF4863 family protein [bacterium]